MDVLTAIKTRRSIRQFKREPISKEIIIQILEAVRWAPSWSNTQCWEVIAIEDQKKKEEIAEAIPVTNRGRRGVIEAPTVLVFLGEKGKAGYKNGLIATDKNDWYLFDVALAVENLCIYAWGQGIGTLIIGYFDAAKVANSLNVPEDRSVIVIVPVGFPEKIPEAPRRKDIKDFLHNGFYGV
jgi:nitroreductase